MPSILQAGNASSGGVVSTGAVDGILEIKSGTAVGGTTAITVDASQKVSLAVPPVNAVNPCMSVWMSSSQSLTNSTFTKLLFQTKEFDTTAAYDNVTNHRYTPQVPGYYQVNLSVSATVALALLLANIYKNGTEIKRGGYTSGTAQTSVAAGVVYLNGTTDYLEGFAFQNSGGAGTTQTGMLYTTLSVALISRSA